MLVSHLIYQLNPPLNPGESLEVEIKTKYITQGFENGMGNTGIVENGSFINNFEILPSLGYSPERELGDKNTRKKFNLKPKDRMPELEENCTTNCMANTTYTVTTKWMQGIDIKYLLTMHVSSELRTLVLLISMFILDCKPAD